MVKGFKHGNTYYISKNELGRFDIYQVFCEANKNTGTKEIKTILPFLKSLPDEEIIVSIPEEKYNAFLLFYNEDITKMNGFRLTLESEQIL